MKSIIYETKGRAREFNELAINLFNGCGHRCVYCYGADVTHRDRTEFQDDPRPRLTPLEIERDANRLAIAGEKRPILLCFVTDPYQPVEAETQITRKAISILHEYGLRVIILTKGGKRATRDFDLLGPGDAFATTLTCMHEADSIRWEPGAAPPIERIQSVKEAHDLGIETWVSLEPVVYPDDSIYLMQVTKDFVDHYKVGPINYVEKLPFEFRKKVEGINWKEFGWKIKNLMDSMGVKYYLKKDLLEKMR